jgi:hypothetical protein
MFEYTFLKLNTILQERDNYAELALPPTQWYILDGLLEYVMNLLVDTHYNTCVYDSMPLNPYLSM